MATSRPHTQASTSPGVMVVTLLLAAVINPVAASLSFLDLTYTQNSDAPASHQVKVLQSDQNHISIKVEVNDVCGRQELGTYLDAPAHFSNGSWSVEDIPLERLWNVPGVVIDVETIVRRSGNRTYAITATDLETVVASYQGSLPDGAVVLLHTGWGRRSHSLENYLGYDANETNHFPGISEDGAEWLATYGSRRQQRMGVVGVGIDTASVDVGDSQDDPARSVLHAHNIYSIHNLKSMVKLPWYGFRVTVMPLKIGGGSVASARVIATMGYEAVVSEDHHDSSEEDRFSGSSGSSSTGSSQEPVPFDRHDGGPFDRHDGGPFDRHDGWPYDRHDRYDDPVFVDRDFRVMVSDAAVSIPATSFLTLLLTAVLTMTLTRNV